MKTRHDKQDKIYKGLKKKSLFKRNPVNRVNRV